MANNKSALKRIKINERNRINNRIYKSKLKNALKKYLIAVEEHRLAPTDKTFECVKHELSQTYQKLDKCVKINLLHINTVSRKKAKLATLMKLVNTTQKNSELPKIKSINNI